MKKFRLFFTILLTLLFLYGIIPLSSQEKDFTTLNYNEWKDLTISTKLIYVIGYIHGSFTSVESIIRDFGLDQETAVSLRSYIIQYYNHDIVAAVDWLYEIQDFRSFPVYNLINNLDYYLRIRKQIYDNSIKE